MNSLLLIFFSLFLNDRLRFILFFKWKIMSTDLFFSGFLIFFPVDFFRFHCRPSLWGICNENKSMEQTLPPIDVVGVVADVLRSFIVDSKAAEPELRMGVSTYSDFKEIVPDQSEGDFGQKTEGSD